MKDLSPMRALVFVTCELFPFTPGGIGRVLFNIWKSMDPEDQARTYILNIGHPLSAASFSRVFSSAHLINISDEPIQSLWGKEGHFPPQWAYTDTPWHWKSFCVFRALKELSKTLKIEYVEFPDWGGLGFCSIQEKKLQGFLQDSTLAVRLHSTSQVLLWAETQRLTQLSDLNLCDLERKCLRDCDTIVGQLAPVAEETRKIFGFSEEEWTPRLLIHAPPVLLDSGQYQTQSIIVQEKTPLLFISKIQPCKRPDLFVRGVCGFMMRESSYKGQAFFCAHKYYKDYHQQTQKLIPPHLSERVHFSSDLSEQEREKLISSSIAIIPSNFESFCLAAYEASLLGACVILNSTSPAFGNNTPWKDGINCFKFDGTSTSLIQTLQKAFQKKEPLEVVQLPQDLWPWKQIKHKAEPWKKLSSYPLVSIVIPYFNLENYLPKTLKNAEEVDYPNIEILVVDDGSTEEKGRLLINNIILENNPRVRIIQLPGNLGLAAARNAGIKEAQGKYILPLDAGDLINKDFIKIAVEALENNPDFSYVIPQAGFFQNDEDAQIGVNKKDCSDYAIFVGEAMIGGMLANRFSSATALFRKKVLEKFPYEESLFCLEDWSLHLRLCDGRSRSIVATVVYLFYRVRPQSIERETGNLGARRIEYQELLRTSAPQSFKKSSQFLSFGILPSMVVEDICREPALSSSPSSPDESLSREGPQREQILRDVIALQKAQLDTYEKSELYFAVRQSILILKRYVPFIIPFGRKIARVTWKILKKWI